MSLQDEHLQTALRNAPDRDLAPSKNVRDKVLNYANHAIKPAPENWLKWVLSAFANWRVKAWQVAGMGALASVLLVIVMVRDQVPQDTIWAESTVEELAQNSVEAPAAATSEIEQEAAKGEVSPSVAAPAQQNMPMRMERTAPKAKDTLTKKIAPAEVFAKPLGESTEMAASPPAMADKAEVTAATEAPEAAVVAAAPASAASSSSATSNATSNTTSAETDAEIGRAKTATAMRKLATNKDATVEKLLTQGGADLAKQDIAVGNLRVLKLEMASCDKFTKHETRDATTNYKIEVINACELDANILQKEVDTYNQTMLNWQKNLKQ